LAPVVSFAAGELQESTNQQKCGAGRQSRDRQP
jgi:hypothetical protein